MNASMDQGDTVQWLDVCYGVNSTTQGRIDVLDHLSGQATPGRLLVIMGPSGSGKTSFLDILCNRKNLNGPDVAYHNGEISVNGRALKPSVRFSYVPQHDTLLNTATVRETLQMALVLRVANLSPDVVAQKVSGVLDDLGLTHRADAMVGGGEIKSLSGGERRRVSIGQEIVSSQNAVLCLDEPTTGLDSVTAESVMSCLKELAQKKGKTVICTIHQPNSSITAMFDDLMLMSQGKCVYFGPFSESVGFFSRCGFECPLYCNPTDFFMTISSVKENLTVLVPATDTVVKRTLVLSRQSSSFGELKQDSERFQSSNSPIATASLLVQVKMLIIRDLRQWVRDPGMFVSELIQYILLGLFIGGMYYDTDHSLEGGVYNRMASLFYILAILVFTPPFTAVATYSSEQLLLKKERQDGMYSAAAWLLAKTVVLAPIEGLFSLLFACISYFMIGFDPQPEKFFIFFGILWLFQLVAESIGLFFAVLTGSPVFAIITMSLFLIVVLSLTGFLTYSMPYFYVWIQDSNVMRFGMLALILNEFEGQTFTDSSGNEYNGIDALPSSVRPPSNFLLGHYFAILVGFLVGFRFLILFMLETEGVNVWNEVSKLLNYAFDQCSTSKRIPQSEEDAAVEERKINETEKEIELAGAPPVEAI
jgi:ABC-type multidrug transport system ATPase subunit/ABC-type multidrug transport system permease subunit